jgi:hypothetical protein
MVWPPMNPTGPMRSRRGLGALLLLLLLVLIPAAAHATEKRKQQDYGEPEPATTPGQVALWVPRVALFPLWLVSEYVVRQPVGAVVRVAEQQQWPREFVDVFTFGDRGQFTIFPSALFDFGLKPSVGFNAKWRYFLAEPNSISLHFGTWGPDWIAIKAVDRYVLSPKDALLFEGNFMRRKDLPFYGMGPESPNSPRYRFQTQVAETAVGYERRFWRSSRFVARTGLRTLRFMDGTCCGAESVPSAVAAGRLAPPPGLGEDYVAGFQNLLVALDSRKPRPEPGSGVRIVAYGEGVSAPKTNRGWIGYGAAAGVAWDVWAERILALQVAADLVDPLVGEIPFTDQVSLGGSRPMRGYLRNRLIDRSALVGTLQYTWPVWVFLDGMLVADVGNVFGQHFDGFAWDLLRMSAGIGVRSNGSRDSGFEILVAGATDPFNEGFNVSSFRFVIGSHHGF